MAMLYLHRTEHVFGKLIEIIVCKYYTSVHIISQSDDFGQVVHTNVPLSPSSITWYQPRGGDSD